MGMFSTLAQKTVDQVSFYGYRDQIFVHLCTSFLWEASFLCWFLTPPNHMGGGGGEEEKRRYFGTVAGFVR
jgi:hypothetical protein